MEHRDLIFAMTAVDLSPAALATLAASFALPFAICFLLARRGHARTAWWLPGGILVLTGLFVALAMRLGQDVQTGFAAAQTLGAMAVPAVLGGSLGILLGRRRG